MRNTLAMFLALAIATPVAFVGCDRTSSETVHTTSTPSGTTTEVKKTSTDVDGGTTVTREKETTVNH
jgi:hypothetical protein